MKGKLIILSGPSGVGKGTIVGRLLKENAKTALSVSCTTRLPRAGEKDGVNYFFVTREKFLSLIEDGDLLEYSEHFGNFYGTPLSFVEKQLEEKDVLLEIDVDGALQAKKKHPEAVLIFIAPPSEEELVSRLRGRGTEDEAVLAKRLQRVGYELEKSKLYDYVVVNDRLDDAVKEILGIIENGREKNCPKG